jgi:hypothetical protein
MNRRFQKQIIIASVYAIIWIFFIFIFWLLLKGPTPTCFDNKKNQGEIDIDCGGPCKACIKSLAQSINIIETGFVNTVYGRADLYALVENPNQNFGVALLPYKFSVYDATGNLVVEKFGKTFILPQQKRYIIEQAVPLKAPANEVKLIIDEPTWTELTNYETPNIGIKNRVYRQSHPDEGGFMTLEGLIVNASSYDFDKVEVLAILRDQNQSVVAVGRSIHNTIRSGDERIFRIVWPSENLALSNASVEAYVLTNVFDNDNFLKAYGVTAKFKKD